MPLLSFVPPIFPFSFVTYFCPEAVYSLLSGVGFGGLSRCSFTRSRRYERGEKKKKGTVRRWELPASEGYPPARESL